MASDEGRVGELVVLSAHELPEVATEVGDVVRAVVLARGDGARGGVVARGVVGDLPGQEELDEGAARVLRRPPEEPPPPLLLDGRNDLALGAFPRCAVFFVGRRGEDAPAQCSRWRLPHAPPPLLLDLAREALADVVARPHLRGRRQEDVRRGRGRKPRRGLAPRLLRQLLEVYSRRSSFFVGAQDLEPGRGAAPDLSDAVRRGDGRVVCARDVQRRVRKPHRRHRALDARHDAHARLVPRLPDVVARLQAHHGARIGLDSTGFLVVVEAWSFVVVLPRMHAGCGLGAPDLGAQSREVAELAGLRGLVLGEERSRRAKRGRPLVRRRPQSLLLDVVLLFEDDVVVTQRRRTSAALVVSVVFENGLLLLLLL
mmetsp:Transcript_25023/g.77244  ORF Transcript_25023/g.77244 Transcript_25023/m.77244 type:complete len:371 (+) Transcript_25023:316-1428(+)